MSEISNKKKKFIKRNFKRLSIEELSLKTGLKPNVIRSLINEYNVEVLEKDQCLSKKLMSDNSSLNKRPVYLIGMLA